MTLVDSVIVEICEHLDDHDKLNYLSTNTYYDKIKNLTLFSKEVKLRDIVNLWYFDRFIRIRLEIYSNDLSLLPRNAQFRGMTDDGFALIPKNASIIVTYIKDHELYEIHKALSRNIYYTKFQSSVDKIILRNCSGKSQDHQYAKMVFGNNIEIECGQTLGGKLVWVSEYIPGWGHCSTISLSK